MSEFVAILVILLVILCIVAVVGHGLWLLVAAIVRGLAGEIMTVGGTRTRCVSCGNPRGVVGGRCRVCGAIATLPLRLTLVSDIDATARQLQRLASRGAITAEQEAEFLQILREERARITGEAPPASAPHPKPAVQTPPRPIVTRETPARPEPAAVMAGEVEFLSGVQDAAAARIVDDVILDVVEIFDAPPRPTQHAALQPAPVPAPRMVEPDPSAPPTPSRTLADVLQSFMEESNIRWGEIISGLLIVVSAIGLVISLWATLKEAIPYLPALIFMLGTAAFEGAGIYTLRRWNLQSISRAVLIITVLLIPLNFLAAIALSKADRPVTDPLYIAAVLMGLLAYSVMVYFASRALMLDGWWRMAVAVMGASAGQLVINRLAGPAMSAAFVTLLLGLPLASYLCSTLDQLRAARRHARLSPRRAEQLFLLLGVATFSLLAPVGLLLWKSDGVFKSLANMSPALSLAAAVVLGTGLLVHHRTTSRILAPLRTTGTTLAIVGAMLMLFMVVLAWPQPSLLIAVGLVNFAVLLALAIVAELPILHAAAVGCLALAYLVGFHAAQGSFVEYQSQLSRRLVEVIFMGRSSVALTLLAAATGAVGVALQRYGRRLDALSYFGSSAILGGISILIAVYAGFLGTGSDAVLATPVLMFYAVCLLVAGRWSPTPFVTWGGSALLWAALVHALAWNRSIDGLLERLTLAPERPILVATLLHGIVAMLIAAVVAIRARVPDDDRSKSPLWRTFLLPLGQSALVSSITAAPIAIAVFSQHYGAHAAYATCIATVWIGAAILLRNPAVFTAFQAMATTALCFLVASLAQRGQWWNGDLLAPQFLQIQMTVLAVWCVAWSAVRKFAPRWPSALKLVQAPWPAVDQCVLGVIAVGIVALGWYGCGRGTVAELGLLDPASDLAKDTVHMLAYGSGAWVALVLTVVALVASLWERMTLPALVGIFVAATGFALLVAGQFESTQSVASALRWTFAIYGAATAAAVCCRKQLGAIANRMNWAGVDMPHVGSVDVLRMIGLALSGVPLFALTMAAVVQVINGESLGGPADGAFFDQIGPALSYALPLLLFAAMLVGYALREQTPEYALGGSLVFQITVTLGFVLGVVTSGKTFGSLEAVELLQWNAMGLSGITIGWLLVRRWVESLHRRESADARFDSPLGVQAAVMLAAVIWLAAWATWLVAAYPHRLLAETARLGTWPSYAALLLALAASIWFFLRQLSLTALHIAGGFAMCAIGLAAASCGAWDAKSQWGAFHVLSAGWLVIAAAATILACVLPTEKKPGFSDKTGFLPTATSIHSTVWATVVAGLVVVLALRGSGYDPWSWWPAALTFATTVLIGAIALRRESQAYQWGATLLAGTAVTLLWIGVWQRTNLQTVLDLVQWNLVAVIVAAAAWLAADVWRQRQSRQSDESLSNFRWRIRVHDVVTIGAAAIALAMMLGGLAIRTIAESFGGTAPWDVSNVGGFVVVATLGLLLIASLWDARAKHTVPGLYAWGVLLLAVLLDQFEELPQFGAEEMLVAAGLAAAGYVALTGHAWKWGANLAQWGQKLGVPDPVSGLERTSRWLPAVSLILAALVIVIEFGVVLTFDERWMRMCAGFAPVLLAYGISTLAQQQRRGSMQFLSLMILALAAVYLGWADMQPSWEDAAVLARAIRLLIAVAVVTFIYGVVAVRVLSPESDWQCTLRSVAATCAGTAVAVLLVVLALEAAYFQPGVGAPVNEFQIGAVSLVLLLLVAGLISLALLPDRGPLKLSEEGRMLYVYAAQVVAALLFAHIYLARPTLFSNFLRPYWPYIVMAIAFAGVGAGEWFRRMNLRVLAEPFQRTAAFLPLLPAIAFWVISAESSLSYKANDISYSLLLLIIGVLYVVLSVLRKSFASGLAAALAGNAALWVLLSDSGFAIYRNPQLWMIPPALCVLVAGQINRDRLNENQLTGLRYLCVMVIYLSSTGEIFIHGIGDNLWPPIILALLAVLGVFVGIAMQVRAFLYLGSSFLLLAIVSMVWHAQRAIHHVWPWWAFGIGLGLLILTMFGIFEKKRAEMLRLVERLRQWER
jgi:hypothetical protein